ncbi:MAG: hypothetical protein JSU73_14230 [candidate division WOR-3 bacterium]|nr:MAG: hypothetical protein JSU73_14230 [candidate division WOR-3 bacterium]
MMNEARPDAIADDVPRCGLCGKTENLTRTECCGQWICDDEDQYVLFSYARNSCHRNHRRYTLCGYHWAEGHEGRWQDCRNCLEGIAETEMYVWYGTNEYNFEKLADPPKFRATFCRSCHRRIRLGTEGHTVMPDGTYYCEACADRQLIGLVPGMMRPPDEPSQKEVRSGEDGEPEALKRTSFILDSVPVGRRPDWSPAVGQPSIEDLNKYVRRLLQADWKSSESDLRLTEDLAPDEVGSTLFLDQARRFLRLVAASDGVGLTPNGWLKRAVVARMIEELDWARRYIEPMLGVFKRIEERDVKPIGVIRDVAYAGGFVYNRRGRMRVPKRILPLLRDEEGGRLYRLLFLALFRRLPLDCLYGPEGSVPTLQQSMAVVLWRLHVVAGDWMPLELLPQQILLDQVRKDIDEAERWPPDLRLDLVWRRALEPLVWFGLLETDREPARRLDARLELRLRKTPLFDRFLGFPPFPPLPRVEAR